MHITLIKPNIGILTNGDRYVDTGRMEPLQLGVLAGLTPSSINITLFDDRCERINYEADTDLVLITVETFTARRAYEIASVYRKLGKPIVFGGFHPTLCPDEASQYADSIVIGNAESVWLDILEDAAAGNLKPQYKAFSSEPQGGNKIPRRDLFIGKGYLPLGLIQFGRGCLNQCDYCAVGAFSKRKYVYRSIPAVINEIKQQNRKLLFFVDDNIVADFDAAKELFRALIPLKIKWVSQGTISMVNDSELMHLMKKSGCLGNVIGFETLDKRNLEYTCKPNEITESNYEEQIRILKSYGLQTWAAFTLGYDFDTVESLYSLLKFSLKHKFTFAAYNVLMPYPGTTFYEKLKNENRLLYESKWWLHPDYRFNHASFVPKLIKPDELTDAAFEIRKKWNSKLSLAIRFLDIKTNLRSLSAAALFWSYNSLFRFETLKKQSMRFGYEK